MVSSGLIAQRGKKRSPKSNILPPRKSSRVAEIKHSKAVVVIPTLESADTSKASISGAKKKQKTVTVRIKYLSIELFNICFNTQPKYSGKNVSNNSSRRRDANDDSYDRFSTYYDGNIHSPVIETYKAKESTISNHKLSILEPFPSSTSAWLLKKYDDLEKKLEDTRNFHSNFLINENENLKTEAKNERERLESLNKVEKNELKSLFNSFMDRMDAKDAVVIKERSNFMADHNANIAKIIDKLH